MPLAPWLLLLAPLSVPVQEGAHISGRVLTLQGPAHGARVWVPSKTIGSQTLEGIADEHGRFELAHGELNGRLHLEVSFSLPGYESRQLTKPVGEGGHIDVGEVVLKPEVVLEVLLVDEDGELQAGPEWTVGCLLSPAVMLQLSSADPASGIRSCTLPVAYLTSLVSSACTPPRGRPCAGKVNEPNEPTAHSLGRPQQPRSQGACRAPRAALHGEACQARWRRPGDLHSCRGSSWQGGTP